MMIRSGAISIIFIVFTTPLLSENHEYLMEKANQAYINESYHEAVELYKKIAAMDYESASLYYNLGNAHYKTGQYAKAILNYERALRLSPSDNNILHNLRIARARLGDRSEPIPRLFFIEWHNSFIRLQSVDGWAITSIVLVFSLCIGTALFFIAKNSLYKKWLFAFSFLMIVMLITALYAAHRQYDQNYMQKEAIVMIPRVTVKSAPSESAVDVFVIHEGRKLEITGELNDWYEVMLPDGNVGWIKKSTASVI